MTGPTTAESSGVESAAPMWDRSSFRTASIVWMSAVPGATWSASWLVDGSVRHSALNEPHSSGSGSCSVFAMLPRTLAISSPLLSHPPRSIAASRLRVAICWSASCRLKLWIRKNQLVCSGVKDARVKKKERAGVKRKDC